MLIDLPREAISQPGWWRVSPSVPKLQRPERAPRRQVAVAGDSAWRGALDALLNDAVTSLDYDDWRTVVFGIHHESGGSDDGLDLALAWSARSPKHNEVFLSERVWPYAHSERGAVITGRSIMSLAARLHGWHQPLNGDSFEAVEGDESGDIHFRPGVHQVADGLHSDIPGPGGGDPAGVHGGGIPLRQPEEADVGADGGSSVQGGTSSAGDVEPERNVEQRTGLARQENGQRSSTDPAGRVGQHAGGRGSGGIPDAEHLATDQANANRLVRLHGKRVLVAESRWHVWDGQRWLADEGDVYRYACGLSKVVRDEGLEWDKRAKRLIDAAWQRMSAVQQGLGETKGKEVIASAVLEVGGARAVASAKAVVGEGIDVADRDEIKRSALLAESLAKWSVKSEMKMTIEAAVGLARKMLDVEADRLDADPWVLNTPSGVVDLRSGAVRAARSSDLMTKLTGVGYVRGADQSVWRGLVNEICGGDNELAGFLQRWFGYCATGSVREQVFVVHWGGGRNGKSTVLDTVSRVLGDYADTAAPGLMASGGRGDGSDRHPTEIASLRGRRMVTAHETTDGAVLREEFVKQATGGDRLTARHMREDFFTFNPTHKLQLLTNHKPTIKGNDAGIWRRVLLVPYLRAFGTVVGAVEDGVYTTDVADKRLGERLASDPAALAGVMAWIVDGAVAWGLQGLGAPAGVRAAVAEYRSEQDRLGQFVRECCEVAPASVMAALRESSSAGVGGVAAWWNDAELRAWSEPLTVGLQGIFPAYAAWCREGGYHGLARGRFGDALRVAVPGLVVKDVNESGPSDHRRRVSRVFGVKLLQD